MSLLLSQRTLGMKITIKPKYSGQNMSSIFPIVWRKSMKFFSENINKKYFNVVLYNVLWIICLYQKTTPKDIKHILYVYSLMWEIFG